MSDLDILLTVFYIATVHEGHGTCCTGTEHWHWTNMDNCAEVFYYIMRPGVLYSDV